jgi:hypothetical protein
LHGILQAAVHEAGHRNEEASGAPATRRFEAELVCIKDPDWESKACNVMAEQWKDIGVTINVNVLPAAQYWEIWNANTNPFAFTSWTHRPLGVMVLGLAYRTGVPWNESYWSNAKFDELLARPGIRSESPQRSGEGNRDPRRRRPDRPPLWRSAWRWTRR